MRIPVLKSFQDVARLASAGSSANTHHHSSSAMPSSRQSEKSRQATKSIVQAIRSYLQSVDGQIKSARRAILRTRSKCEIAKVITDELQSFRYLQQRGHVLTSVHHDRLEEAGETTALLSIGAAQLQIAMFLNELEEINEGI